MAEPKAVLMVATMAESLAACWVEQSVGSKVVYLVAHSVVYSAGKLVAHLAVLLADRMADCWVGALAGPKAGDLAEL